MISVGSSAVSPSIEIATPSVVASIAAYSVFSRSFISLGIGLEPAAQLELVHHDVGDRAQPGALIGRERVRMVVADGDRSDAGRRPA